MERSQAWLAGQKEAFQAAMNGAPLETSLAILIRTAIEQADSVRRCAFYLANSEGTELRHVTGMGEDYARCIDRFEIGPESLSCGLAVHTGQPVITRDVNEEPRWKPWLWLAEQHGYRGCWSFPVETSAGKIVGTLAMYFREPREATLRDHELAASLTHTASIIISRHQESEERARISRALAQSEGSLAAELAAARHLQTISTLLIQEGDVEALYKRIVEAARELMRSDMASIQVLDRERDALQLLANIGFDPQSEVTWRWVARDDATSCSAALKRKARIMITDTETCASIAGRPEVEQYRHAGIRAMQSTPLIARSGDLLGMISTHWRVPHEPSERDLRIFDVLARQAADLIERKRAEDALQRRAEQLKLLLDELNHRVKNTLATVQSMAMQTLRNCRDTDDAGRRLESRLIALAQAHDILTQESWEGAPLLSVVEAAVAAYRNPGIDRFEIKGPAVWVSPKQALALAMALHELATNAVKYGSLSNNSGFVTITWSVARLDDIYTLQMNWTEAGGPPVDPPLHRGFGSRLIERGLKHDLGGEVQLDFSSSGVHCVVNIPVSHVGKRMAFTAGLRNSTGGGAY